MRKNQKVTFRRLLPVAVIVIFSSLSRIPITSKGFFAFTYDQGRDFLAVSRIISQKDLVLIGHTTGLEGIFYGPWWYYFLAPIILISGGDPQKVANFFGLIGIFTIVAIYFLIRSLTNNSLLSLGLSTFASISKTWMFGPTLLWNPSLAPFFLIVFLFCIQKILNKARDAYFFVLGLSLMLIMDSAFAFGLMVSISTIAVYLFYRKIFLRKRFFWIIFGSLLVLLPRIIFEIKYNFLMTKATLSYFLVPKIFGEKLSISERLIDRIEIFFDVFKKSFARDIFFSGILILCVVLVFVLYVYLNSRQRAKILSDKFLSCLMIILGGLFISFTLFPDRVWDYYLVGLPIIYLVIIAKILEHSIQIKKIKLYGYLFVFLLVVLNFYRDLLPPYKITWLGDDAVYRNQKMVMDYVASQNPKNYSFYSYSSAIFDYPFDYLIYWYGIRGLIMEPRVGQDLIYLVIRNESNQDYIERGWYGDKTKNNTKVVEKKEFPGDILLEKHVLNEK